MALPEDRLKKLEKQMGMLTTHPVFSKFLQGGPFAIPESGMLLGGRRIVGGDPTSGQVMRWNPTLERYEPHTLTASDLASHVLANTTGLGPNHSTSGLTARQVLIATGATTALFRALEAADLPASVIPNIEDVLLSSEGGAAGDANAARLRNLGLFNFKQGTTLTINAGGDITATHAYHLIQGAGGAADDLDKISVTGTELGGQIHIFQRAAGVGTITVKHNVDTIQCVGSADFDLDEDWAWFWALHDATRGKWMVMPGFGGAGGGANHDILDGSVHQDSVADAVTQGSLIIGNATPKWDELPIGGDFSLLNSNATTAVWTNSPSIFALKDLTDVTRITLSPATPFAKLTGDSQVDGTLGVAIAPADATGVNTSLLVGRPAATLGAGAHYYIEFDDASVTTNANNVVVTGLFAAPTVAFGAGTTGNKVRGLNFEAKVGSSGDGVEASNIYVRTAMVSFSGTLDNQYGLNIDDLSVIAGTPTLTTSHGIRIGNQAHSSSTLTYGIKVEDQTGGTAAYGIYIEDADTYALFVDAGLSRFDGDGTVVFELPADATDPTSGGGAAAGRIPVKIGGATKYLAYY